MSNVGAVGGTVGVFNNPSVAPNVYTVVFGGTLACSDQQFGGVHVQAASNLVERGLPRLGVRATEDKKFKRERPCGHYGGRHVDRTRDDHHIHWTLA